MWLAERVWDPDLPRVIAPTGLRFTLLDDSHFFAAGVPAGRLSGHYITDKAGEMLSIFPIDKGLRYAIPFRPIADLTHDMEAMNAERGADPRCLTYGDDGEKFGLWPGTSEWVFGKGWLKDFFRFLSDRNDLVTTRLPSEALAETPPTGRVYLPTASYEEMGEWSLPTKAIHTYDELKHRLQDEHVYDRYQPFVRGGIGRGSSRSTRRATTSTSACCKSVTACAGATRSRRRARSCSPRPSPSSTAASATAPTGTASSAACT